MTLPGCRGGPVRPYCGTGLDRSLRVAPGRLPPKMSLTLAPLDPRSTVVGAAHHQPDRAHLRGQGHLFRLLGRHQQRHGLGRRGRSSPLPCRRSNCVSTANTRTSCRMVRVLVSSMPVDRLARHVQQHVDAVVGHDQAAGAGDGVDLHRNHAIALGNLACRADCRRSPSACRSGSVRPRTAWWRCAGLGSLRAW